MVRNLIFMFVFMSTPLAINVSSNINTDINKVTFEGNTSSKDVTKKEKEKNDSLLVWHTANASYYDSMDTTQTGNGTGIGAFGRRIKSGSIALGSHLTKHFQKKRLKVFIQVENSNITTPYGKGIFRVDDVMDDRYNKKNKFYIDFYHKDLNQKQKLIGRFRIKFRICKVV